VVATRRVLAQELTCSGRKSKEKKRARMKPKS
jgi:hypothetical protein